MLFAQLLYTQFYTDKEYVRGDKFWEDAKFAELLAQINYHAAPDQDMITDGELCFQICAFFKQQMIIFSNRISDRIV